nr:protein NETWORKED 4B-like [Lepeophtheirus salmonis]
MSEEEEDPSSSDEASDEDYDEDEEIVDWDWARSLKPSKLKEDELKRLIHIFQTWKPPDIGEEVGMEKKVLLMYELSVGAFLSRESDLKDALEELQEKGGRGSEDKLREENKQLKSQVKNSSKNPKVEKTEILQLEQELSRYKHECDHLEREVDRERGEINNLKDELVDSRRSVEDDEAEAQEVELKRVRELEESIRLKNKQIHQLLEDIELVL